MKVPLHSHSLCVGGRARLSAVRRAETPRSADRRAETPRSADRRAVVRWAAAAQTPLADDSSASFHTPDAGVTPVAPADAVAHAAAETPPARNIFF